MATATRREYTVTLGYWDFITVQDGQCVLSGTLAGMMDRAAAEREIRATRFLGSDAVIELAHHTYQIPAEQVS